ncbi:MAG: fatty acid desaturase [Planctomycetota bacterium]
MPAGSQSIPSPSTTIPTSTRAASAPTTASAPWTWPWYRWQRGEGWTFFWICWIHAFAILGFILFPLPGWKIFFATYALTWLGGLGTTVGYHRAIAHKALKLHPAIEFALVFLAIFNGSGSPATWTANHRLHHANTETPLDISSPRIGGFWWSHLKWLWQSAQSPIARWAPDLNTPYYLFWTRWQIAILAASFFIGLPLGWSAFFWLGAIRLTFSLHGQCFVNSLAHMKPGVKENEDSSRNLVWLGLVQSFQGENWHGNHHAHPTSAQLGWSWRQVDMGWWVIFALERLGLARNVRRHRTQRTGMPQAQPS